MSSNIQMIHNLYPLSGKELSKIVERKLKDYYGVNWVKEASSILNKEITEESFSNLGPKEMLNIIIKKGNEIFKKDFSENDLKRINNISQSLLDFKNELDHTNTESIRTEEALRLITDFKDLFNFFKDDVNPTHLEEIKNKFASVSAKLNPQRGKKAKIPFEITDIPFKNSIEKYEIDPHELEDELQDEIQDKYPDLLDNDNITTIKVEFNKMKGFAMILFLKWNRDSLEIVKGSIKKIRS